MSRLFIASGPSGAGKSSVMKAVMSNEVIGCTTRPPRPGEVDGKDYYFITQEEFDDLLRDGKLAEHTDYYGSASYGSTKEEIRRRLDIGDAFVIVDFEGYKQIKAFMPEAVGIFFYVSEDEAFDRMLARGDRPEKIGTRLATFQEELDNMIHYDFVVDNANGQFERTVATVKQIVGG